ncbi:MAG: hypothetical protein IT380_30440 [Myxococcales bacterium]|nr:hypothetical protein [Myxococcales bacterium]
MRSLPALATGAGPVRVVGSLRAGAGQRLLVEDGQGVFEVAAGEGGFDVQFGAGSMAGPPPCA